MVTSSLGPLEDGGRVVIIGGGPGGTSCAMALQRKSATLGRRLKITLVEGKQFTGELHHNQCVGVLSPPLPELLSEQLGVPFPYHLSRNNITGYILHTRDLRIDLGGAEPSIAVRRVQFDAFMLDLARERGIEVVPARAVDVDFGEFSVVVYTENQPIEGDVVVGAFGMDDGCAAIFTRSTPYHLPEAMSSIVTKFHPGAAALQAIGSWIHAFLPPDPGIEFGGVTPKGNHLTINIAGKAVNSKMMVRFLAHPEVRQLLVPRGHQAESNPQDGRFYKGRFPCDLAEGYYGDRYVMVGDAAGLVRPFKGKGVTSAILSGIRAAETILAEGISKQAFHRHYRPANRDIISDLIYGKAARLITVSLAKSGLLDIVVKAAETDDRLRSALFGAVSAQSTYREVLGKAVSPHCAFRMVRAALARNSHPDRFETQPQRHADTKKS